MRSVLIDANLLVLLLLGQADERNVGKHKKLKQYDIVHFQALIRHAGTFARHVSTPHVLTETSNLLNLGKREQEGVITSLFAEYCSLVDEVIFEAARAAQSAFLPKLGLTDTIILERIVPEGIIILTDDYELSQRVRSIGGEAINIWHTPLPL